MRASQQTRTLGAMIKSTEELNSIRADIMPSCPEFNDEEYTALIGQYGASHIKYSNEGQFWARFMTISLEGIPKLRAKLRANEWIRNLQEKEVLQGEKWNIENENENSDTESNESKSTQNAATNPDTEPSTDTFESLPYINEQVQQKNNGETTEISKSKSSQTQDRTIGIVGGIDYWKRVIGAQETNCYKSWLDQYRSLFIQILTGDDEPIYNIGGLN